MKGKGEEVLRELVLKNRSYRRFHQEKRDVARFEKLMREQILVTVER
ncbi:MAG: hypothetical protein HXX11_19215 [Desulfuromonadales bacterium]|nr:hypothetical protein [Desulfuromonadales bacterium]